MSRLAVLVRHVARSLREAALLVVDPPECRGCGADLDDSAAILCGRCRRRVLDGGPQCRRCGAAVGPSLGHLPDCHRCRDESWAFDRAIALGAYANPGLQEACVRAKRPSGTSAAAALAGLWVSRHVDAEGDRRAIAADEIDAVVPVPRHWRRRLGSGASGSERLAEAIARRIGRPLLLRAVRQVRPVARQASLAPSRRRTNLVGAFAPGRCGRLDGARVLLVDDILTTGQTAHRVAVVLRSLGAASVTVAAMARGTGETAGVASPPVSAHRESSDEDA